MRWIMICCWLCGAGLVRAEAPIRVTATVGMVADVVREVAGEAAVVSTLIGEGIDPHVYKPTRHDVLALRNADMVFYNGLLLEGRMAELLEKLKQQGKPVLAVAEAMDRGSLLDDEATHHHDPHVWMDVALWAGGVDAVARALAEFRPDAASDFRARAQAFRGRLSLLDAYIREVLASIPPERRILITAHDAFHYFGRAYGIEVRGIQGLSTESEAGLNDINRLVDLLVERGVRAIFVETSVADKNVKALIEGARSRGHEVVIGGSLFSDAMGATGTYEGTYIGMLEHNANTVATALGGRVPPGGFAAWSEGRGGAP